MIALLTALAAVIIAALALSLLMLLVVGARREDTASQLPTRAPGPLASLARRITGVHVRRPSPPVPPVNAPRTGPCGRAEANR